MVKQGYGFHVCDKQAEQQRFKDMLFVGRCGSGLPDINNLRRGPKGFDLSGPWERQYAGRKFLSLTLGSFDMYTWYVFLYPAGHVAGVFCWGVDADTQGFHDYHTRRRYILIVFIRFSDASPEHCRNSALFYP